MIRTTSELQWSVTITVAQLIKRGCPHADLRPNDVPVPGCLSCEINMALYHSPMESNFRDVDNRTRVLFGTARTDEDRVVLSRLIAWAYGHPDPLPWWEQSNQNPDRRRERMSLHEALSP